MPRTQQTASEAYEARLAAIQTLLLGQLPAALEAHDRQRSSKPGASADWGYAGDLESVQKQLEEALRMLGGKV